MFGEALTFDQTVDQTKIAAFLILPKYYLLGRNKYVQVFQDTLWELIASWRIVFWCLLGKRSKTNWKLRMFAASFTNISSSI